MKKKSLAVLILSFFILNFINAQPANSSYEKFGDISAISQPDQSKWQQQKTDFTFSQADISSRINYNNFPVYNASKAINLEGWRDEDVDAEVVISTKKDIESLNITVSDLVSNNGGKITGSRYCKTGYVYYVIANSTRGICAVQPSVKYDDIIVPDVIDFQSTSSFAKSFTNRPVWIKIKIPADAMPGNYKGKINASINGTTSSLDVIVKVSNNKLPSLANRKFFLELWQYPVAEADYYKVKPWSAEHFNLMKPAMENLRDAGEDVITASFFWDQFNPAARSADDMFIKTVKTKAGAWTYDYTNFDKWVNYMMSIGINKQITVFGLAPLNYKFYYYNEDSGKVVFFQQKPNASQYQQFWSSYLKDFEQHLKEKGWFNITTLGFSEKDPDVLVPLINFIKSIDNNWKISFSGKYNPDIQSSIYDYSLISNEQIPAGTISERKNKGFITTYYTSCWERFPNTFVMSDPMDAAWLGWNAAYRNMDGYLRYAYDYWTMPSVLYNVKSNIASGDRFLIYPDGCSSIRFEMLREGIEDYEKIIQKQSKQNASFNSVLSQFDFKKAGAVQNRGVQINSARQMLNN